MRFTSPYPSFKITAIHGTDEPLANGASRPKPGSEPSHICRFEPMGFTTWEREEAFRFFGDRIASGRRKTDNTLTTDSPMDWRIGTYDTEEIDDPARRAKVEKFLLEYEGYGRDYMHFPKPKLPAPWAKYDDLKAQGRRTNEMVAEELVKIAEQIGADPGLCMGYEMENLNRPEVVAAFEALANRKPEDDRIVVNA